MRRPLEERAEFIKWVEELKNRPEPARKELPVSKPAPAEYSDNPDERFHCESCGDTFSDDSEAVALYECGECGSVFTRETSNHGNHQCPDCNKFGSKLSDCGCPHCNEGELVEHRLRVL